ncbi:MAG: tRNA (guanosine(46)-N7)-methyltransferase TrmB [Gammaproteobacteria bacterium]|nr:tRNA (guanosine(46)-N7)-methyltransferase TrmB [Gammaproteobacteria bacterium]
MYLTPENTPNKKIRSFIRRQGRITQGQQWALDQFWDKYCLRHDQRLNHQEVFGRIAPLMLEIGFGNGDCLAQMAKAMPEKDFIGIEVHRPGVGRLLMQLEEQSLTNVRVYCHDAIEILQHAIPNQSLSAVHLFFPDPWPKLKHHKRRIVQPEFLNLIAYKLLNGGYFHAATDWQHYAESMLETLLANSGFNNASSNGTYCDKPDYRPLTKFEQRGLRLGHGVWDLVFVRQ